MMKNSVTPDLVTPVQSDGEQILKRPHRKDKANCADKDAETAQEEKGCEKARWCDFKSLHLPRLNKLSLRIFGSEGAVKKECDRQKQTGQWVIHPLSPIRHYYVLFMVLLTFVSLVTVPLEMAFAAEAFSSISNDWLAFNLFSDILFIIDVGLNFRTGILTEDSEIVILDLKAIRNEYLKTWFIPDILSAFSIDLVIALVDVFFHGSNTAEILSGKMIKVLMFARVLSLIRVLRMSRLVRFFRYLQRVSHTSLFFYLIVFLFILMVLLCHWNGCIQYFIPMLQGFPSDCWTVKENVVNGTFAEKYLFSMFRAVSHMVKISYGSNDPPTDELEMWVVMTSMLSGIVMHIMIFSSVLTMMIDTDGSETTFKKKMKHIEDYMTYKRLPRELRTCIREYYRARYKGRWVHENSLSLVSKSLKEETLTVLCAHLLKNVPMFQKCDTNLISAIVLKLQHEVFLEGDIVIRQNAPGDRMFFIEHGQVIVETQSFQKELHDGDYFGEVVILTRGKQLATVRALSTCRLFSLSADDFHQVLQEFHHTVMDIEGLAQQHYEDLKSKCKYS
ncbi:hypothetical protein P4O66_007903 [Electrophorus voltai]|uniref:Cyclic nucleotide-binding domain-containing protein n=1 Tax=Electrophorus voltai TaxID=2609070 RepID=A0AAD9E073_9TELE|nr:hypothetical protein P4O66_007903 [Electrophorus voltai]